MMKLLPLRREGTDVVCFSSFIERAQQGYLFPNVPVSTVSGVRTTGEFPGIELEYKQENPDRLRCIVSIKFGRS